MYTEGMLKYIYKNDMKACRCGGKDIMLTLNSGKEYKKSGEPICITEMKWEKTTGRLQCNKCKKHTRFYNSLSKSITAWNTSVKEHNK